MTKGISDLVDEIGKLANAIFVGSLAAARSKPTAVHKSNCLTSSSVMVFVVS